VPDFIGFIKEAACVTLLNGITDKQNTEANTIAKNFLIFLFLLFLEFNYQFV